MRRYCAALKHIVAASKPRFTARGSGGSKCDVLYCAGDLTSWEVIHGQSGREEEVGAEGRPEVREEVG